jgi:hypothetical protein
LYRIAAHKFLYVFGDTVAVQIMDERTMGKLAKEDMQNENRRKDKKAKRDKNTGKRRGLRDRKD